MKVTNVGAFEAKTRLSQLLDEVERGRVIHITKRGRPVAELRPIAAAASQLRFGADRGHVHLARNFDAPLPEFDQDAE